VHGAIGALPRKQRPLAESQLQAGTLEKLTEAMAAWIYGIKMDAASFAHHFFDRAADDPVVASLRSAASDTVEATTRQQLAKASGELAEAMKAVGLDNWSRFVAKAQTRAHFKATLAAIQTSRQPPDIGKDAIKPVSFGTIMAGVGAAVATAELDVPALIAVGAKAIANKVLGDKPAPAEGEQDTPQVAPKDGEPPKAAAPAVKPSAIEPEPPAAATKVWAPPKDVTEKIPPEWGPGRPNKKGTGLRWTDPKNKGNGVRVDRGDPKSPQPSQRTDHALVRSKGKVIGRDGKPIAGSISENGPDAHIPLREYRTWSKWNKL